MAAVCAFFTNFCMSYMFMPFHTANLEAIKALGYSDLILKIEIIKKVLELLILLISLKLEYMQLHLERLLQV